MRNSQIDRKTKETHIRLKLNLDGNGKYKIQTPVPFFNHMLELFAKHGNFSLELKATGDVDVDDHHLVEDTGIVLGKAFREALGDKRGISRYGFFIVPMDETRAEAVIDFSDRPCLVYRSPVKTGRIKNFEVELVEHFFEAFVSSARVNLHLEVPYGRIKHHIVEGLFKAFARACAMAVRRDPKITGIPSTKGKL